MKTLIVLYALVMLTLIALGVYIESIIQQNTQPDPPRPGYVTTLQLANTPTSNFAQDLQPTISGDQLQKGETNGTYQN